MKKCTKCKEEKEYSEYSFKKTCRDGYASICKNCVKEYSKIHYYNNKEKRNIEIKEYVLKNKEKINQYQKLWVEKNKEKIKEKAKEYRENNKELIKEKRKEYLKEYRKKNREKINKKNREYESKKIKEDLLFKFKKRVRDNVLKSFKRGKNQYQKNAKTESILGCTILEFKVYIKSKFKKGMTFENIGKWHLDHIIPLSKAKTEQEIIKLNHYTNFQPLWAEENLIKSDKIIEKQLTLI